MRRSVFPLAALLTFGSLSCGGSKDNTTPTPTAPTPKVLTTIRVTLVDSVLVVGKTTQATAATLDQFGAAMSDIAVTWRSSDSTIASVSATGQLSARSSGNASVIASASGKEGSAVLRSAAQVVTTVRVTLADNAIVLGKTTSATAAVFDQAGSVMQGQRVAWTSTNPVVASVDSMGKVTALSLGETQVTATVAAITGQSTISTKPDPVTATKYRAMAIGWYSDNGFDKTAVALQSWIDRAVSMGYNSVKFQYNVDVADDGTVLNTLPQTKMMHLTDYARQRGLKVLHQVFWVYGNTQDQVGNWATRQGDKAGFDNSRFLRGVDQYWTAQSRIAESHGVSMLFLGQTNFRQTTPEYRETWRQIISHVKQGFTGLVSFEQVSRTTQGYGLHQVSFWDLFDVIGVAFAPNVIATPVYDVTTVQRYLFDNPTDQSNTVKELIDLTRKYSKPIIIANINIKNVDAALYGIDDPNFLPTPHTMSNPQSVNNAASAAAHKGMLEVWNKNLGDVSIGYAIGGYEPWVYNGPWVASSTLTVEQAWKYNTWKFYNLTENAEAEAIIKTYNLNAWGYHTTDVTNGSPRDDIIYVSGGTNTIYPLGGRDEVRGASGVDTVVINALSTACVSVTNTVSSTTIPKLTVTCGSNVVQMWDIEYVRFNDKTVSVLP